MNKKLILNLIFPLTSIMFILFTKFWVVNVVDGTDGIMYGFPFIYKSPAFYTSMAEEFFMVELITDIAIYFGIITIIIYCINKLLFEIKIQKKISYILFIFAGLSVILQIFLACMPENKLSIHRNYDIVIKQTGIDYPFNMIDRKEYDKDH